MPLLRTTYLKRKKPIRRKSFRQKTIEELDRLAKAVVIERDGKQCLRCGTTENLQASHIFPKGKYPKMRFDVENIKILCFSCHIGWWHKNIILAGEWIQTAIGRDRYKRIVSRASFVDRSRMDLQLVQLDLLQQLKKYKH